MSRIKTIKTVLTLGIVLLSLGMADIAQAQLNIDLVTARRSRNPEEKPGTYIIHVPIKDIKADDVLLAVQSEGAVIDILDNREMLATGGDRPSYIAIDHLSLSKIQEIAGSNDNYLILRMVSTKHYKEPDDKIKLEFVYQKSGVQLISAYLDNRQQQMHERKTPAHSNAQSGKK